MPRRASILIHYTHKETFGHTTRMISLCRSLLKHKVDVHVLQGGLPQPDAVFPPGIQLHQMPDPFDSRHTFTSVDPGKDPSARTRFILAVIARVRPAVFVTEFFPFGRMEYLPELLPVLRSLRKNTRLIASIGYPYVVTLNALENHTAPELTRAVIGLYDQLIIHTPPKLENSFIRSCIPQARLRRDYDNFFQDLESKISYSGYILPDKTTFGCLHRPSPPPFKVVISRGGGAVYPNIIACALRCAKWLDQRYHLTVTAGPSTTNEEWKLFNKCLNPDHPARVTLIRHTPDLSALLRSSHLSISMAGYNTSVQLMAAQTPSLLIPYANAPQLMPFNDQQARVRLLQEYLACTILDYADLSPEMLARHIRQACEHGLPAPSRKIPSSWFRGGPTAARLLVKHTAH